MRYLTFGTIPESLRQRQTGRLPECERRAYAPRHLTMMCPRSLAAPSRCHVQCVTKRVEPMVVPQRRVSAVEHQRSAVAKGDRWNIAFARDDGRCCRCDKHATSAAQEVSTIHEGAPVPGLVPRIPRQRYRGGQHSPQHMGPVDGLIDGVESTPDFAGMSNYLLNRISATRCTAHRRRCAYSCSRILCSFAAM